MSGGATVKEIDLGDGFGEAVLKVNGTKLEVHADGSVDYTNGPIHVHAGANACGDGSWGLPDNGKIVGEGRIVEVIGEEPKIGDKMPAGHQHAGWIYGGKSRTTQQPFYVAPKDSGVFQWKEAMAFAAKDGSRLPSKEELDQIYDAKDKGALKGTFNVTGSNPAGWYWSSLQSDTIYRGVQRFSDGLQSNLFKNDDSSLRFVR